MSIGAGPHVYLCMFCTVCFSNLVCLILYTFTVLQVPMSGCVGMGLSALLCLGAFNAVKMALHMPTFYFFKQKTYNIQ